MRHPYRHRIPPRYKSPLEQLKKRIAQGYNPASNNNAELIKAAANNNVEIVSFLLVMRSQFPQLDPAAQNYKALKVALSKNYHRVVHCLLRDQQLRSQLPKDLYCYSLAMLGYTQYLKPLLVVDKGGLGKYANVAIKSAAKNQDITMVHLLADALWPKGLQQVPKEIQSDRNLMKILLSRPQVMKDSVKLAMSLSRGCKEKPMRRRPGLPTDVICHLFKFANLEPYTAEVAAAAAGRLCELEAKPGMPNKKHAGRCTIL